MNGFKIISDTYKQLAIDGKITTMEADKKCKVYDFLSTCDKEDINNLFNSGALNDITKEYLSRTINQLIEENVLNAYQGEAIKNHFNNMLK